jgi:hypothetical protein
MVHGLAAAATWIWWTTRDRTAGSLRGLIVNLDVEYAVQAQQFDDAEHRRTRVVNADRTVAVELAMHAEESADGGTVDHFHFGEIDMDGAEFVGTDLFEVGLELVDVAGVEAGYIDFDAESFGGGVEVKHGDAGGVEMSGSP